MERLGRLLGLLALACCVLTDARAEGLACGAYVHRDGDGTRTLLIESTQQARLPREDAAAGRYLYSVDGPRVRLYDLEDGYGVEDYTLSRDRTRLRGGTLDHDYRLEQRRECRATPLPAAGACRADLAACYDGQHEADIAALQGYCNEGMAFACSGVITALQKAADARTATPIPDEPPPECREGDRHFDADACQATAERLLTQVLGEAFARFGAEPAPLPATDLDRIAGLCHGSRTASVCQNAADALWRGGRLLSARDALGLSCDAGSPEACTAAKQLVSLTAADEAAPAATTLPCGRYVGEHGLMSDLLFADHGLVEGGFGSQLRARIEAGAVRIRHDKGGDFVLRPLSGQRLLGMDSWNRYTVYQRDGGPARCAAPIVYREVALKLDCPLLSGRETAQACCARGNLHGCNTAGSTLALADRWSEAKPYYARVCEHGVRAGCENLVQVYARGGDESAIDTLAQICAGDERHVACDVHATSNWAALGLNRALMELARDIEADLDASGEDE